MIPRAGILLDKDHILRRGHGSYGRHHIGCIGILLTGDAGDRAGHQIAVKHPCRGNAMAIDQPAKPPERRVGSGVRGSRIDREEKIDGCHGARRPWPANRFEARQKGFFVVALDWIVTVRKRAISEGYQRSLNAKLSGF